MVVLERPVSRWKRARVNNLSGHFRAAALTAAKRASVVRTPFSPAVCRLSFFALVDLLGSQIMTWTPRVLKGVAGGYRDEMSPMGTWLGGRRLKPGGYECMPFSDCEDGEPGGLQLACPWRAF